MVAVTLELTCGDTIDAVLCFHDGTTLVYEGWNKNRGEPSGDLLSVPLDDVVRVIVP